MKNSLLTKYVACPFCTHVFGKATEIGWYITTCSKCNTVLDVRVTKYGVKVERHKQAS